MDWLKRFAKWGIRSNLLAFCLIFGLAFAIRCAQLGQIPERYLVPNADWELGAVAISLYKSGEFADPYLLLTGPTAHLPPLYPGMVALLYHILGLTVTAGKATWLFQIASAALLYALLPWLAEKLDLGRLAGWIGGLAGAVWVDWAGHGEYLTGLALGMILVVFLNRWLAKHISWAGSIGFGIGIGISFHLQPALLPVVLGCLLFELWHGRDRKTLMLVGVVVLGIGLACIPWAYRNYRAFDAVFFIRSNFGLELRMGNHEGAAATMEVMDAQAEPPHPRTHISEALKVKEIGEIAYMRQAGQEALDWITAHPGEFISLTLQRAASLWFGPLHRPGAALGVTALTLLAVVGAWANFPRLSVPQRAAVLIALVAYPMVYYVVAYMPRYRVPIDWILLVLAGAGCIKLLTLTWGIFIMKSGSD